MHCFFSSTERFLSPFSLWCIWDREVQHVGIISFHHVFRIVKIVGIFENSKKNHPLSHSHSKHPSKFLFQSHLYTFVLNVIAPHIDSIQSVVETRWETPHSCSPRHFLTPKNSTTIPTYIRIQHTNPSLRFNRVSLTIVYDKGVFRNWKHITLP
jgi:hypothetical protein